jgi:hypothetical protein
VAVPAVQAVVVPAAVPARGAPAAAVAVAVPARVLPVPVAAVAAVPAHVPG